MAGYQRKTALPPAEVLEMAETYLPEHIGLSRSKGSSHGATYSGAEGTVSLSVHRHGPSTEVTASTDRLRTSRIDYEIQKFLTHLPYEPGDRGGPGSGEPPPDRPETPLSPAEAAGSEGTPTAAGDDATPAPAS